jgi:GTP-binding protein
MFANNWAEMPHYFVTSATESIGKEELLVILKKLIKRLNNSQF